LALSVVFPTPPLVLVIVNLITGISYPALCIDKQLFGKPDSHALARAHRSIKEVIVLRPSPMRSSQRQFWRELEISKACNPSR